jgi:hypothetical protein
MKQDEGHARMPDIAARVLPEAVSSVRSSMCVRARGVPDARFMVNRRLIPKLYLRAVGVAMWGAVSGRARTGMAGAAGGTVRGSDCQPDRTLRTMLNLAGGPHAVTYATIGGHSDGLRSDLLRFEDWTSPVPPVSREVLTVCSGWPGPGAGPAGALPLSPIAPLSPTPPLSPAPRLRIVAGWQLRHSVGSGMASAPA